MNVHLTCACGASLIVSGSSNESNSIGVQVAKWQVDHQDCPKSLSQKMHDAGFIKRPQGKFIEDDE